MNTVTEYCKDCRFYYKSIDSCDYFEIMNDLRPCPPGDACTVKEVRGEQPKKPKPATYSRKKWDYDLARRMWIEGVPGKQIAEAVGCSDVTIYNYAKKNGWPKRGRSRKETDDVQEETETGGSNSGEEAADVAHQGAAGGAEEPRVELRDLGSDAGSGECSGSAAPDHWRTEGGREVNEPNLYQVLEAAAANKTGIMAICTAEAISNLWNWETAEDLRKAAEAIAYMLGKMEK